MLRPVKDPTTVISLGWTQKNGETLTAEFVEVHGGRYEKDFDIPAEAVDFPIALLSTDEERQGVLILCDLPLTLKPNVGIPLKVCHTQPVVWAAGMQLPCPLQGAITQILVTNPAKEEVKLKVRILERKPIKPTEKAAEPAPAQQRQPPADAVPIEISES